MRKKLFLILFVFLGSLSIMAQKNVTGVVLDDSDYPMPGVTVLEKGTSKGVITDVDGKYSIEVAGDDAVLQFSFVGMLTQEIPVGVMSTIDVVLYSSISDLDEVVVVGYGVQKKRLITGANISVGADALERQNSTQALEAIQAFAPGVNITQVSGMPGQGFNVNIRGLGTVGHSAPLYVIDGVPGGDINSLNPADIESIDVLKDAASAAIYGSRAANGVILVTTKGGSAGKMTISYDGYYGWQSIENMVKPLDAKQFMEIYNEERLAGNNTPLDFSSAIPGIYSDIQSGKFKGTNFLEEAYNKNAPIQSHAINIAGGSEQSVFSLGFSFTGQEGVIGKPVQPSHDKYTFRINSDHVLYEKDGLDIIKFGETLNYNFSQGSGLEVTGMYNNDVRDLITGNPLVPVYNADGDYYMRKDLQDSKLDAISTRLYNPIARMDLNRGQNHRQNYGLNTSAYLEIQPIKNLVFKSSFGYRMNANAYRSYQPEYNIAGDVSMSPGRISQNASSGYSWTNENTLSYGFMVEDNQFDILIGQSAERWGYGSSISATNANPTFVGMKHAYLYNTDGLTSGVTSISGEPHGEGSLASFFGRVNYNYKEKYLLTATMRADGSSNFAPGKQWGYFPSVSAGWVLTEEDFLYGNGVVDFLKLRASWGQNGNAEIDPFQFLSLIAFDRYNNYTFGGDRNKMQLGGYPSILPNPDVSWETSEQLNIGVDLYFLNSRLQTVFEYYNKKTIEWLLRAPVADIQGPEGAFVNAGDIENKGIELGLKWQDRVGQFNYGAHFNLSRNKNLVTRYGDNTGFLQSADNIISQGTDPVWRVENGYPVGYFYGYKTGGVFQNQAEIDNWKGGFLQENPEPGDLIFLDTNGDGKVDGDDKTMIGNPHPKVRIGFGINLAYKGVDFSVIGKGAFGHQIMQSYRSFADNEFHNYTTDILNRWHGEGTSNKLPKLTPGNGTNRIHISDLYIEDGDFVKIQEVTLGYDLKSALPKMPLGQARIYVAARNLMTFTKYSGMDPEVGYGDEQPFVSGIDLGFYPTPRTYLVGINLKF